jgi:hypothetical protein
MLTVGTSTVTDKNGIVLLRGAASSVSPTQTAIFNELNGIGSGESLTLRSPTGFKFQNNDGSSEWMRLTSTGLGIGTSSPASKLDVVTAGTALKLSTAVNQTHIQFTDTTNSKSGFLNYTNDSLIYFRNGPAQVFNFDSAGNFGLGVTPSAWASGFRSLDMRTNGAGFSASDDSAYVSVNAYNNSGWKFKGTSIYRSSYYSQFDGAHIWYIGNTGTAGNAITFTQAMTLDASGNLLVGTTSSLGGYKFQINGDFSSNYGQTVTSTASSGFFINFSTTSGQCGYISGSGTSTSYVTSSDYRLKNTIEPMTGALAKVALLKPCTFKWNANGSDGQGFIAHELKAIVPDAVVGEKDDVDAEGKPIYQGIDTSFLVATLTAAIQEQQALIQSLTDRIAQLEAK